MANEAVQTSGFPQDAKVVAPNDSGATTPNAVFGPRYANMIFTGAAGNVTLLLADSNTTLLVTAITEGEWHPMPPFVHVNGTGTTSTPVIVGLSYE